MAYKKSTSKVSKKVEVDLNLKKPTKKTKSKAKKQLKKLSFGTICLSIFLLAVGIVGGYFGVKYITRNDCFYIIGEEEIFITLEEDYLDEGVKVVAFGVDDSKNVKVETNLKTKNGKYCADSEGTYYIKYTIGNIKYGSIFKVQKIRLVHVVEPTENEEVVN